MYIFSREMLSERTMNYQQIYISYFEEDATKVNPILDELNKRYYLLTCNIKSHEACIRNDYVHNTIAKIKCCSVGIVIISKRALSEPSFQQFLWYEIGYIKTNCQKLVPFYLDINQNELTNILADTPTRQFQGTYSLDDLLDSLKEWKVHERIFYKEETVNRYALSRIRYVKISSLLNIYQQDLDKIFPDVSEKNHNIRDLPMLLNDLLEEMKCGCTVMRFGKQEKLTGEKAPFDPEVHTIVQDYPIKQDYYKPVIVNSKKPKGIYAIIKTEFILPVHQLLGVTFKPFISINRISDFSVDNIRLILNSNSHDDCADDDIAIVKKDKEKRIYFLFDVDTTNSGNGFEHYGKLLNYFWPA